MSGSKHTPGPWTLEAKGGRVYVKASIDGRGKHVASVIPIVDHDADMPFNADLIAAAPAMANLLKEWQCFVLHGTSRRYSEREMLEWTAAVLAKAGRHCAQAS